MLPRKGAGYFDDILAQTQDIKDGGFKFVNGQWYKNSFAGMQPVSPSKIPKMIRDSMTIPKAPSRPKKGLLGGGPVEDALGKDVASIVNEYVDSSDTHKQLMEDVKNMKSIFNKPKRSKAWEKKYGFRPWGLADVMAGRGMKKGKGWEDELKKAMEKYRLNEIDNKTAEKIRKAAAADAKKRTGQSIKRKKRA
jgi:hypothetical protein